MVPMDTKKLAQSSMAAVTQNLQRKRKRRRKIRRQLKPNKLLIVFLFAFEINYGKYTLIVFPIQNCYTQIWKLPSNVLPYYFK